MGSSLCYNVLDSIKDFIKGGIILVETNVENRRMRRELRLKRKKRIHKILTVILLAMCIVTAIIVIAAILSGAEYKDEESFRAYAAIYFEEAAKTETREIGTPEESVSYGTPLSTAMEYPVTGQSSVDSVIKNTAKDLEQQFKNQYKAAKKEEKVAMLMDYDSYKTQRAAIGIVFSQEQRKEKEREMQTVSSEIYTYNFSTETGMPLSAIQIFNTGYRTFCSKYMKDYFESKYQDELVNGYEKAISDTEKNFNKFVLTEKGVKFYFDTGTVLNKEKGPVAVEVSYEDLSGVIRPQVEIRAIDPSKPMVALTFDDGPFPKTSNRILDCLEKNGVPATFFELGQNVAKYPEVVKREAELGMEIGSHSWSHPDLKRTPAKEVKKQIDKTNQALQKACGQTASVFRPPYGNNSKVVEKYANAPIILWSVDTLDWKSRNAKSIMKVVKGVKNLDGRVILMHSIYDSTAKAVEQMVPWLLDQGYQLVTVRELLKYRYDETPKNGKLYGYGYFYTNK